METIACPRCHHEFELSEALSGKIRDGLKSELLSEISKREAQTNAKLNAIEARELELVKKRDAMDEQVKAAVQARMKDAEEKAKQSAKAECAHELKDLQQTLTARDEAIKTFREHEMELRKEKRELEQAKENMQLEVARRLDEERERVRGEVEQKSIEQHRLKDLEKEKLINDLRGALEDMQRKANQGSMETQGEVLERDFEAQLKRFFLQDEIRPVPKGVQGADLIHIVKTSLGGDCGMLLWETKNAKAWGGQWIPKLKADMIETRATLAILVSVVLPEGISRFGMVSGVWVSDPISAIPLASALREHLLAVNCERQAATGKNEKMEILYSYLAGTQFKQKIEGIVDAFTGMHSQLNQERRAMEKQWKEREKQIERVMKNTVGLYGDMQGIIGGHIPAIPALEIGGAAFPLSDGKPMEEIGDPY